MKCCVSVTCVCVPLSKNKVLDRKTLPLQPEIKTFF